jgi:RHS repeat-associated protein
LLDVQSSDQAGTHAYAYDARDRISAAQNPTQTVESYTYDGVGNRTASHISTSYSYQSFNRVVTIGSNSYSYDSNGNLTSKTDSAGTWGYSWDYENRLKQVTRPDSTTISYKYDALGRRIQRSKSGGGSTNFVYDGQDVIKDINSDNSTVEYLNGLGIDDKLRQTSSAGTVYFTQDHLGSTRALTDSSGNVVESVNYDSFGNGASSLTRYGYTGREWDADANLYYYRNRWYDPQVGRFISEDPIGLGGGMNMYAYVGNDSISNTDPSGLRKLSQCVKNLLQPYFPDLNLNDVNIHDDGLPLIVGSFNTLKNGPGAFTFENDIYFPANTYDPYTIKGIKSIGHELVHVGQFKRLGTIGFVRQYANSYLNNIQEQSPSGLPGFPPIFPFDSTPLFDTTGFKAYEFMKWLGDTRKWAQQLDLDKAYREVDLERDAYDFENDLERYLKEIGDPMPCKQCEPS